MCKSTMIKLEHKVYYLVTLFQHTNGNENNIYIIYIWVFGLVSCRIILLIPSFGFIFLNVLALFFVSFKCLV